MRALAPLAVALAACSVTTPAGDPFPVHVDLAQGPVVVHVGRPGEAPITASLDVLAPFTLIDPGVGQTVERQATELALYGERTPGSVDLVERARFSIDLVLLHPCDAGNASCEVGVPGSPTAIGAVLGADALGTSAIRFDFPDSDLFVFPDIAGSDDLRDAQCDARFPSPFRGGGTLVLGGADVDFNGRRIAVGACLEPPPDPAQPTARPGERGANALFVVSTGIGPTILGATAYARYCPLDGGCNPDVAALARTTVLLPSGPVSGGAATIDHLALVANPSHDTHGPCAELFSSYCLPDETCRSKHLTDLCTSTSCGAPATVELSPAARIPVVVVADDDPTLQALRAELRPDQPEVDGILGVDALRALQLDVDYPNNRLLARCGAGAGAACATRPTLGSGLTVDPGFPVCR